MTSHMITRQTSNALPLMLLD